MGFCSELISKKDTIDSDTMKYLATRPDLMTQLEKLLLELKENPMARIPVAVENCLGQCMKINLMGINATSLVSSEIEGHLAFTFIKDLISVKRVVLPKKTVSLTLVNITTDNAD